MLTILLEMMKAYIIRHAEKQPGNFYTANLKHNNPPISHNGKSESKKLYRYLKDKGITKIFVSAYIRTLQTIDYTATKIGLIPIVDEKLNEIDNGTWEKLTEDEIQNQYPHLWKCYSEQSGDFCFPDGETGEEAGQRATDFLEQIKYTNERIIAVSHDGFIRCLACYLLDIPVYKRWNFKVEPCGIMEIEYNCTTARWTLIRFNQSVV